jgi:hypothetical protein
MLGQPGGGGRGRTDMHTDGRCPEGGRPEAAGWVLSALDPDDARDFGEHLLTCEICRAATDELRMTARILQGMLLKGRPGSSTNAGTPARAAPAAGQTWSRRAPSPSARTATPTMQMWSAADPRRFPTMEITKESPGDAGQHGEVILSGTAQA